MAKKTTTQIADLKKAVPGQEKKLNDLLKAAEADAKIISDLTAKLKEREATIKAKDKEISLLKKEKTSLQKLVPEVDDQKDVLLIPRK